MAVRRLQNFVNGTWVDPAGATYLDVENPSTGEIIAQVPLTSGEETVRAIDSAYTAYLSWKDVPVSPQGQLSFQAAAAAGKSTKRRSAGSWWRRWASPARRTGRDEAGL